VLVVSHDIELMDSAIDRVIVLENAQIDQYKGTYSDYVRQRAEREAQRARDAANTAKEVARLERTLDKFRKANATHAKKRAALRQRIDRIHEQRPADFMTVRKRTMNVRFPDPVRAGDVVMRVEGLAKRFGDTTVFEDVDFLVERGRTFLVLGLNGAGKTTLLRCLAGIYQADGGTVRLGSNVTLGFYAQEHEDIRPGMSVISLLRDAGRGMTDPDLRKLLGHFGLTGDVADQDAGTLSGGEKTKLALCRLVIGKANVLLLDEPTNNLDPASREAVLAALQHYKGTILLVSHDEEFVTQLEPDQVLILPEGEVAHWDEKVLDLVALR
jgi:ATPase subunit of ABC transporter with duplicated ATPase domains